MNPYLHTSQNLHLIAAAAKIDDLDAAVLHVMEPNNITTGDIAGQMFADWQDDWANINTASREHLLCEWLQVELQSR